MFGYVAENSNALECQILNTALIYKSLLILKETKLYWISSIDFFFVSITEIFAFRESSCA